MLGATVKNLVAHVTWHLGFVHFFYSVGSSIAPLILDLRTNCGEWFTSYPGHLITRERVSGTHWAGGWVGLRADLGVLEKIKILCPWQESSPDCSACDIATVMTTLSWFPWWDWIVQSMGFWVVIPCHLADGSQSYRGTCYTCPQGWSDPKTGQDYTVLWSKTPQWNSHSCENFKSHIEHYHQP